MEGASPGHLPAQSHGLGPLLKNHLNVLCGEALLFPARGSSSQRAQPKGYECLGLN